MDISINNTLRNAQTNLIQWLHVLWIHLWFWEKLIQLSFNTRIHFAQIVRNCMYGINIYFSKSEDRKQDTFTMLFEGAGLPSAVNPCSFLYPCQEHLLAAVYLRQRIYGNPRETLSIPMYWNVCKRILSRKQLHKCSFIAQNCFCWNRATSNVSTAHLQASMRDLWLEAARPPYS